MTETPPPPSPDQPHISPPPSKDAIDEISKDQALITDEWAPEPPPGTAPDKA